MKTVRSISSCALAATILIVGCQPQPSSAPYIPNFDAAVRASAVTWVQAWADGDADAVANLYAADAMLLPPNGDVVMGRDAIREFWAEAIAGYTGGGIEPVETYAEGNLGVEVGRYANLSSEGDTLNHGKYIVARMYADGAWKMHRDIWNPSGPSDD